MHYRSAGTEDWVSLRPEQRRVFLDRELEAKDRRRERPPLGRAATRIYSEQRRSKGTQNGVALTLARVTLFSYLDLVN